MNIQNYFPNRVRAQCSTNSTGWQIVGITGTGYASYAALVAAGDTPFPGSPADFPMGVPNLIARTAAAGGTVDGSSMAILTNSLATPGAEDDLVSASGQQINYSDEAVKNVWIKKTTGTDIAILTGLY